MSFFFCPFTIIYINYSSTYMINSKYSVEKLQKKMSLVTERGMRQISSMKAVCKVWVNTMMVLTTKRCKWSQRTKGRNEERMTGEKYKNTVCKNDWRVILFRKIMVDTSMCSKSANKIHIWCTMNNSVVLFIFSFLCQQL